MTGSTETQFTATGPATIGFQTQPPETNTQFEIGVDVSGLSIGVKGTGTLGERSPPGPDSGGTGVQGNGTGVGPGVAGFGGNATPGTINPDPSACAGVVGRGGLGPQSGGPGVAGFGGPNSGVGVFGQGGGPSSGQPGGPGVKGIGGGSSADGVQGFATGTFSGVAGFGGDNSGSGVFGFGGGPGGPGVRGFGSGATPLTVPSNPVGVYGQGGPQSPGVVGQAGSSPADGVQGFGSGTFSGVAGFGGSDFGTGVIGFGGSPGAPGVRGIVGGGPNTLPSRAVGVFGQGNETGSVGVQGVGPFGVHGIARGIAGDTGVVAEGQSNGIGIAAFGGQAGFFGGDLVVFGGTKSAAVPFPDGSHRLLYCLESPDSWFEDFGFGHLTDGRTQIQLDPDFAATVNTDGYHVFIAEYDDNNGLFVTNRTSTGFEVRAKTSASEAAFSYRVVAKRKDVAPARFAKLTLPASLEEIKARVAKAD